MEAKATRFLTQFSRAVFQQWTQTPERELFWKDGAFLYSMLEEAVAKLPRGKLKAQLTRDLKPLETQLASLLRELHVDYVQKQQQETANQKPLLHGALLSEELTELALAQDTLRQVAGVLALDAGVDGAEDAQQEDAEKLVQLFALIAARSYETPLEQQHKRGLVLKRLADYAQNSLEKLCSTSKNWSCGEDDAAKQVQRLRVLLERVVVQDAVALAQASRDGGVVGLKAPWTIFYRPEQSKQLKKVPYGDEVAKIYGVLLTLAVYFPIDNEDEGEEETSDESASSEDEDEESMSVQKPKKLKTLSVTAQAQLSTRQILLAAQMRQREPHQNGQWLVSVLTFMQGLPKPATYLDEDEDQALDTQDRHALLECLGLVYTRAFASAALFNQDNESAGAERQDGALFEAVVCLRHAAQFMRVELKSNLPAITTAMAYLAGLPLPASFTAWLDNEQKANPASTLDKITQRLWKKCTGETRMVNFLLSSTDVSAEEMPLIQKSYLEYLEQIAEGNTDKSSRQADVNSFETAAAEEVAADAGSLFYVDNAGGNSEEPTSKSKKKRMNRKKKRANKTGEVSPSKRSRVSSS